MSEDLNRVIDIRKDLAMAHQLFAEFGWDDLTYTHLTARHPNKDSYFIMPFGYLFVDITPDMFLEVDFKGRILSGCQSNYNPTGHVIHGAIYEARPDVNAVFHSHTPDNIAVASQTDGLLPLSQWALLFYQRFGFHDYDSLSLQAGHHGKQLVSDLKDHPVLLMRNHGVVVAGKDIAETFYLHYHLEMACRTQCRLLSMNESYEVPSHEVCVQSARDLLGFEKQNGHRD